MIYATKHNKCRPGLNDFFEGADFLIEDAGLARDDLFMYFIVTQS